MRLEISGYKMVTQSMYVAGKKFHPILGVPQEVLGKGEYPLTGPKAMNTLADILFFIGSEIKRLGELGRA